MLPTKIYKESPFKALKIMGIIFGPIFLLFAAVIISDEMPGMNGGELNSSAFILLSMAGIFGGFFLLTFLILSFQHRKTIKCDFNGFEVLETNYWQTGGISDQFKWNEVTDTNIVENLHDVGEGGVVSVYTFVAETDRRQVNLLDLKTSTKSNIEGLINYVNEATPHSRYFWVKDKNVGNRQAIESVYGFTKVVRTS